MPLIAVRKQHDDASAEEKFYPPGLSFPVTAFLRVLPEQRRRHGAPRRAHLELYDPLNTSDDQRRRPRRAAGKRPDHAAGLRAQPESSCAISMRRPSGC